MSLRDDQIERYARHILLPDVGGRGQKKLLAATARVELSPGDGAAICALTYLAAAGIGRLELAGEAKDAVTAADAASGIAYGQGDVGRPRIDALADRVRAINPDVEVTVAQPEPAAWTVRCPPTADMAAALIAGGLEAARAIAHITRS